MKLFDSTGRPITLNPIPLAIGGEGAIHDMVGDSSSVAKLYKTPPSPEHAAKLQAMAQLASPSLLKVAAWPTATVHLTPGGPIAGVLMPKIAGYQEIHHLYSVAQRKKDFPEADWRFLVHAARNCAIAFEAVHAAGHVVGDVNQKNVLVSPQAIVQFVDCDSFQIQSLTGKLYRCEVGVPEFTPPELQGQLLRTVDRTLNHDRFGLAVMLFHLLMMGRHPFSGVYSGRGDMPLEKAISTGRFAYLKSPETTQMKPPPGTPPIGILNRTLYDLFKRAFTLAASSRPSPTEWKAALDAFSGQLGPCQADNSHFFVKSVGTCPWCQLLSGTGILFFLPKSLVGTKALSAIDLAAVWAQIERITPAGFRYTRPSPTRATPVARSISSALGSPSPRPSPPQPAKLDNFFELVSSVGMISSLPMLMFATPVGLFCLFVFSSWLLILVVTRPRRWAGLNRLISQKHEQALEDWEFLNRQWVEEFRDRTAKRDQVIDDLARLEATHQTEASTACSAFDGLRFRLQFLKTRLEESSHQYESKRRQLLKDSQRLQKDQYLDALLIANSNIKALWPDRVANLRSFGIETALDVERLGHVKVPQIGPILTQRLAEWRDMHAQKFRFDATLPSKELLSLEQTHRASVGSWEAELATGPGRLRELVTRFQSSKEIVVRQVQAAVDQLHQAELDVEIMERMLT